VLEQAQGLSDVGQKSNLYLWGIPPLLNFKNDA